VLKKLLDNTDPFSLATNFAEKIQKFLSIQRYSPACYYTDVGGTADLEADGCGG
jgi:hypothetical protein